MTMNLKYCSAAAVLLLAVLLQAWFAPGGIRGDFVLAALIVFAFVFGFVGTAVFSLLAIWLVGAVLYGILPVALILAIPLGAWFLRRRFSLDPRLGVPAAIAIGIAIFYLVTAPAAALGDAGYILADIAAAMIFGELMLLGLER